MKIFLITITFLVFVNIKDLFTYHPYQGLYFNNLITKKLKEKFEVDFTGLSGIEFLRDVVKNETKSKINIGINSWYPLYRMKE